MKDLLFKTTERAIDYLDSLNKRRVLPDPAAVEKLIQFDIPMPEKPCSPESVIKQLDELGSPATMAMAGPRFFGFVIGGSLPASLAAHWLASAWDQNSALNNVTPATSMIEQVALKWLLDVLQLPKGSGGAFVTGTTVANFTALIAARHKVLADLGWNVEADGLYGAPEINVYLGEEAHTTLFKSISMTGLGGSRVKRIPVDNQGRIRLDSVPEIIAPAIFCVQAGNVNTGGFDPVEEICDIAHDKNAWVHVDGAFGLWARAAKSTAHLGIGIDKADSWATDAHKWLNVPYDSGVAFVKDAESLRAAMSITAEYLPTQSEARNPSDYTPELSRRARGVDIWAALLSLGREGVSDLIERNCRHAKRFAEAFSKEGFEILNDVQLNQVLVSFGTPDVTNRVVSEIQFDGTCWCGTTIWQGKTAMRISVSGWNTTEEDVEKSINAMLGIASKYRLKVCPVEAIELITVNSTSEKKLRKASLNERVCLGCGLCVKNCNKGAMKLQNRQQRIITPVNSVHRVVMMAIDRGKLQNLIFDKHALWNHRAMAAILGVILKLPPIKQTLASTQFKSKYLEILIKKFNN